MNQKKNHNHNGTYKWKNREGQRREYNGLLWSRNQNPQSPVLSISEFLF